MADIPEPDPLPSIAALPPTTVRLIGSSQVLVDPSSAVKELVDNALDARANAIFVDIAANTVDTIQVKDTGHGIPQEDRPLACRRYCTSKIRDFADLKEVGGKWLGFRGEALASMAEMSRVLEVTTRVEGEPVAAKMKYGKDGELASTERASAPVGTTVKITDFFKSLPVRKQAALKHSSKWLAKIRRLIQAYALARPAVRFSLRILKAKSNKGDFMYAPKKDANVEDALLKVIGKDCALQYDWAVIEADGFEIRAFLPKPSATRSKVANEGAFVSIDSRPVSASRGTPKQLVTAFRQRLRMANPTLGTARDPFFCMNIICPPDSYDPNIEPAKDDVLFENEEAVVTAVDKLLTSYYPMAVIDSNEIDAEVEEEIPRSAQQPPTLSYEELSKGPEVPILIHKDPASDDDAGLPSSPKDQPQWRSIMYGIDEEDLQLLSQSQPPVLEEEEGRQAADASNPWTIARMSASIKGKDSVNDRQLMSPAQSQGGVSMRLGPPAHTAMQHQQKPVEPLTPQDSPPKNMTQTSLDDELERSIQRLPGSFKQNVLVVNQPREPVPEDMNSARRPLPLRTPLSETGLVPSSQAASHWAQSPSSQAHPLFDSYGGQPNASSLTLDMIPSSSPTTRHVQRKKLPRSNRKRSPGDERPNDTWFGQSMRGLIISKRTRQRKPRQTQQSNAPLFPSNAAPRPRRVLDESHSLVGSRLASDNNTDIRNFFGRGKVQHRRNASDDAIPGLSFTPIDAGSKELRSKPTLVADGGNSSEPPEIMNQLHAYASGETLPDVRSRAASAEPRLRWSVIESPSRNRDYNGTLNILRPNNTTSPAPKDRNITTQLRAWEEREDPSSDTPASPTQPRCGPRIVPAHETALKARPARCRTMDGAHRPKSARLPLERVPSRYKVHDVVMLLNLELWNVIKSMNKTDMARNSLEWGYGTSEDAFDTFSSPITNRTVDLWALKIAQLLNRLYEQENDVDVFLDIGDGIRKALRDKSRDAADDSVAIVDAQLEPHTGGRRADAEIDNLKQIKEWTSQVLACGNTNDDNGDVILPDTVIMQVDNEDEFEEGIDDDEMLLDF